MTFTVSETQERLLIEERKDRIRGLLKGIETGDPTAVAVVNPDKYIQHNPQTQEGGEGEDHRKFVGKCVETVLVGGQFRERSDFVSDTCMEHNPHLDGGLPALRKALRATRNDSEPMIRYEKLRRVLAEGDFVLSVCEGAQRRKPHVVL